MKPIPEKIPLQHNWITKHIESHHTIDQSQIPKWKQMLKWVSELPKNIQTTLNDFLYEQREINPTTKQYYYQSILEQKLNLPIDPITKLSPSNNSHYEKFLLDKNFPTEIDSKLKPQRALIFVPHADDIAYSMGAFMTHLKEKYGKKIVFDFVIGTDGTAGFSQYEQKKYSKNERKKIRQYEQIREAIELGASSIAFLHYQDSKLEKYQTNTEEDLIREIQITKPTYIFSYAPNYQQKSKQQPIISTNIEHVDHVASGQTTHRAIIKSGMRAAVPNDEIFRHQHRPQYWFQFGYNTKITPNTNFMYQPTPTTFIKKLSAFAMNKSQVMMNWKISAKVNALHYLTRVNREIDQNNAYLSENFMVQEITKMKI